MGQEHRVNLSEQLRGHQAVLHSNLERSAAHAVLAERFAKLPTTTSLPSADVIMNFGDVPHPETWREFGSYCARYSLLSMIAASEDYLGQLLFMAMLAKGASGEGLSGEEFHRVLEKCRKVMRSTPRIAVRNTLAAVGRQTEAIPSLSWFNDLYRLRNCLMHRNGKVGVEDVDANGVFSLTWQRPVLTADDQPIVSVGQRLEKGQELAVQFEDEVRVWKVGEVIRLTAGDCQEMAWSLFSFSIGVSREVHAGMEQLLPTLPKG